MYTKLLRCPQCKTVGKVHRSRTRNFGEKVAMKLVPIYGVYRCHHCNWRGWTIRRRASKQMVWFVVGLYIFVVLAVLAVIVYIIILKWPSPQFKY